MSEDVYRSYASKVDAYIAGRPEYPVAMLNELPDAGLAIDVGAGTGISTECLSLKAEKVLAVEPIEGMAKRIPIDRLRNVSVVIASAEAVPVPDACAGLILCATAFHWFDYPVATAEFFRVLQPNGQLALVWNVRDSRVPWVARFDAVMDSYAGETPRQSTGKWRRIFEDARFSHMKSRSFPHTRSMPRSGIVDRALSTSFIAALPASEQQEVRSRIDAIMNDEALHSGRREIDFPYVTELYLFRKN